MTDIEKEICSDVLRYGEILSDMEYFCESENVYVREYVVDYEGELYYMTKNNGEWVYFLHCINGGKNNMC